MKHVFIKTISLFVFSVAIIVCSYYWGYLCGRQSVDLIAYDRLLLNLSTDILILDSLEIDDIKGIKPLVESKIESNFIRMSQLYKEHKFENEEYVRCAISRRIRSFKERGQIMTDEKVLQETEFSINEINNYLKTECLGKPSHSNWKKLKQPELE